MYGFYPRDEVWRVNLSYIMLAVAVVPLLFDKFPFRKHFLKFTYIFPVVAFFLGAILLGEEILVQNIIALIFIISGIFISRKKSKY